MKCIVQSSLFYSFHKGNLYGGSGEFALMLYKFCKNLSGFCHF